MSIFNNLKYNSVLAKAEQTYNDNYNFSLPIEDRTEDNIIFLKYSTYFETLRENKILPDKFEDVTSCLKESSPFYNLFIPNSLAHTRFDILENLYQEYIYSRARGKSVNDSIEECFDKNKELMDEAVNTQLEFDKQIYLLLLQKQKEEQERIDSLPQELNNLDIENIELSGFSILNLKNNLFRKNGTWDDYIILKIKDELHIMIDGEKVKLEIPIKKIEESITPKEEKRLSEKKIYEKVSEIEILTNKKINKTINSFESAKLDYLLDLEKRKKS